MVSCKAHECGLAIANLSECNAADGRLSPLCKRQFMLDPTLWPAIDLAGRVWGRVLDFPAPQGL